MYVIIVDLITIIPNLKDLSSVLL